MGIDIVLVQLAIVFLPGLIWAQIDARYAAKEKRGQIEFFIRSFLFGISTYAITYVGYRLFGQSFSGIDIEASAPSRLWLDDFVDEIVISSAVSFVLAIAWIYASTYKLLHSLLRKIRATKSFGDEDVWGYTFNSTEEGVEYVHIRDFDRGITYAGWVRAFSESGKPRELLLKDVIMYDKDGSSSASVSLVYLARHGEDIHIEFPYRRSGQRAREEQSGGE